LKAVRNGTTVKLLGEIVEVMRRRALLAAFGGTLPVSIAGCLGNGDDDAVDEEQEDDETDATEETEPEDEDESETEDDEEEEEDDGEEEEEEQEEEDELEIEEEISVTAEGFDPSLAIVERGTVVGWTTEETPQDVAFFHQDNERQTRVPIETEAVDETATAEEPVTFEFTQEGVYDFYHGDAEEDGVVGSVIVGDVADVTQPGLSVPAAEIPDAARAELQRLNEEAAEFLGIELQEPPSADTDIELSSAFDPQLVHKEPGGTVTWTAIDDEYEVAFYHEDVPVVLEPPAEEDDETNGDEVEPETEPRQHRVPEGVETFSDRLSTGEEVSIELTEPGVYDWYCQTNESDGMVGSILVGDERDNDQPGLQPPDETIPDVAAAALSDLNQRTRITFVVAEVNQVITALNHQEDESISVLNSYIESDETVSYLIPVQAETPEEATAEAERLRSVRDNLTEEILTVVPREANRQLPIPPLFQAEDIETPSDAREEADELESEEGSDVYGEAPVRLREAADFTEALENQLTSLADQLESVGETS